MQKTISKELENLIDDKVEMYRDYSGRCMYGEKCIGIMTNDIYSFIAEIILAINKKPDLAKFLNEFADLLKDARIDSVGYGSILYFPHYKADETKES